MYVNSRIEKLSDEFKQKCDAVGQTVWRDYLKIVSDNIGTTEERLSLLNKFWDEIEEKYEKERNIVRASKTQAKRLKDNSVGGYRKGTIFLEIKNMAGFTNSEKEELYVLLRAWQGMGMGEQEIRNELHAYGIQ